MTSYNAGNVAFYENLHKKYFDKAKGAKESEQQKQVEPPNLLDLTDDGASKVGDLSRFMADSRLNDRSSRSRSRSRGGNSTNMLHGSKISSANNNAVGFSRLGKGGNTATMNDGFRTTAKDTMMGEPNGGHGGLDDDTNLFELTEKSNNTYMALSYWNQTSNNGGSQTNRIMTGAGG